MSTDIRTPAEVIGDALRAERRPAAWLAMRLTEEGHPTTAQAVTAWVRGQYVPRDDVRAAVARILGIDLGLLTVACALASGRRE